MTNETYNIEITSPLLRPGITIKTQVSKNHLAETMKDLMEIIRTINNEVHTIITNQEMMIMMNKTNVVYDLLGIDLEDETNNLLLNMSGGLLPIDLSAREVCMLKVRFGDDWFHVLGYKEEDGYENPNTREHL